jgi:hypothetical protein
MRRSRCSHMPCGSEHDAFLGDFNRAHSSHSCSQLRATECKGLDCCGIALMMRSWSPRKKDTVRDRRLSRPRDLLDTLYLLERIGRLVADDMAAKYVLRGRRCDAGSPRRRGGQCPSGCPHRPSQSSQCRSPCPGLPSRISRPASVARPARMGVVSPLPLDNPDACSVEVR